MKLNKAYWLTFLLFVFTIPISQIVSVRVLVLLFVVSFFMKPKGNNLFFVAKRSWDVAFYFSILAIGLIYSQELSNGLSVLETNFSFLAIPMVISRCPPIDRGKLNELFRAFKLGLVVASLTCLAFAAYNCGQSPGIQHFFYYRFTEVINSHPTYFAYYIIFVISVELFTLYYDRSEYPAFINYLTILFLFFILILTGGQTAFIAVLFVFSFFILKFSIEERTNEKRMVVGFVLVMLFFLFFISIAKNEFFHDLADSWDRVVLWESALSAIPNLFLGVGTGDYRVVLNDYYVKHNLAHLATESYNSHNQMIQILFSNGILGLLGFSLMLIRPLFMAVENKNILAVFCFFPFLIYGVTEAFLGRFQGVVFFALLHQVFVSTMQVEKSFSTK